MSSETDKGYVHRPGNVETGSTDIDDEGSESGGVTESERNEPERVPDTGSDGLGRRGWVLVGVVVFAFLVVPGVIYLRPATPGEAGLPFIAAMLVLPLLPAFVLGLTAVWSMTGAERTE